MVLAGFSTCSDRVVGKLFARAFVTGLHACMSTKTQNFSENASNTHRA
jgi:hypothetical protein